MPHVSSKKLNEAIYQKLFEQLSQTIARTQSHQANMLLSDLLTETEQVMLSKRLAAVVMFADGYSQYEVENTLSISPSTAARLHVAFEAGAYKGVLRVLQKDTKQRDEFWETLEVLLRLGMPSMGKERWKHLR